MRWLYWTRGAIQGAESPLGRMFFEEGVSLDAARQAAKKFYRLSQEAPSEEVHF